MSRGACDGTAARGLDAAGMEHKPIVVVLELQQVDDSLSGRITGPDGESTAFTGWLGLNARLDTLLREAAEGIELQADDPTFEGDPS